MTLLRNPRNRYLIVLIALFFVARVSGAQADPKLNRRLEAQIAKVRMLKPSMARFNAGDHLADLTYKVPPNSISNSTVQDLISLLDNSDDVVRFFAAAALGNIKAKSAIPKMLAMLPAADCLDGTMTSANSLRAALEKMGVSLPPKSFLLRMSRSEVKMSCACAKGS